MDIGSLAPFDFVIILCFLLIGAAIGVVLYRSTLRVWLQKSRFPFTLRVWTFSVAVALIALMLYWFLFDESLLAIGIGVLAFLIYSVLVWSMARRPRVN